MMACLGSATFDLEAKDQWSSLGSNEWNWGRQTGISGDFNESVSVTMAQGSNFPAVIVNIKNSTDENEFIGSDGTSIKIYKANNTVITNLDEYVTIAAQSFPYEAVEDANGVVHLIAVHGSHLYDLSYNSSGSVVVSSINLTERVATPGSYIKCTSERAAFGVCYWVDTDSDLVTYSLATQNISNTSLGRLPTSTPTAIGDVDNDGVLEFVYLEPYVGGANQPFVNIVDLNTETIQKTITITSIGGYDEYMVCSDVALADLDGGNMEVLVACYARPPGGAPYPYKAGINAYNLDGSLNSAGTITSVTGGNIAYTSKILFGEFYAGNSEYEACLVVDHIAGDKLVCNALPSGTNIINYAVSTAFTTGIEKLEFSAGDLTGDGYPDLIIENKIYDLNTPSNKTLALNTGGFILSGDLNNDDQPELLSTTTSSSYVTFSDFTNSPPIINANATFKVNFNPTIICNNSALTFSMKECGAQICQYTNDVDTDTERIRSRCGGSGLINGTSSLANPTLSCSFTQLGTYTYDVYLEDNKNVDDVSAFKSFTTNVVLGTPGIDCNLPPTTAQANGLIVPVTVVDPDDYTTEGDIDYVVSTITGQSEFMNNIMVLIFTVMIFLGLAKLGHVTDFRIYAISIFSTWIGFASLGILQWIYVVIIAIVFIAIGALSFAKSGGNGDS